MKADFLIFGRSWIGLLVAIATLGSSIAAFAQGINSSAQTSGSQSPIAAYAQLHRRLAGQYRALIASGATGQQITSWLAQNTTGLGLQDAEAAAFGVQTELTPFAGTLRTAPPPEVTGTLRDLLITQLSLAAARAQIHNQILQSLPSQPARQDLDAIGPQQLFLMEQYHAADLQTQRNRAEYLTAQFESTAQRIPPLPRFPSGASPQIKAFMLARYALFRDRAELHNQLLNASPGQRMAAYKQWIATNASRLQQLHQLAEAAGAFPLVTQPQ